MLIVFNPTAGRRRAHLLWRVLDVMAANGVRLELAETRHAGHATELAREAAARGAGLVVAAGGDGTIAEVANGLNGSGCRLGVIPLGTANVLAHELGLPFKPRAVAAALAFGRTREVWPGIATGAAGSRLFVQMLGAGFDAQVVHRAAAAAEAGARPLAPMWRRSLRELARYQFRPHPHGHRRHGHRGRQRDRQQGSFLRRLLHARPRRVTDCAGVHRGAVRPFRARSRPCCTAPRCR